MGDICIHWSKIFSNEYTKTEHSELWLKFVNLCNACLLLRFFYWLPHVSCGVLDLCRMHVPNAPRARVAGMDGLHCNSCFSVTLNCVLSASFFLCPLLRHSSNFCGCSLVIGFVDFGGVTAAWGGWQPWPLLRWPRPTSL